jgi:fucose permease
MPNKPQPTESIELPSTTSPKAMDNRSHTFGALLFGFVLLGIGNTIAGVAWPTMASDLGRPLAQLGFVSLAYGSGYTVSTVLGGPIARRYSVWTMLAGAATTAAVALGAIAASPSWPALLVAVLLFGVSGGATDIAGNTFVAIKRGTRSMGLLHAAFGVGATLGPLLVAGLLALGTSWRFAFLALGVGQLLNVISLSVFARGASVPKQDSPRGDGGLRVTTTLLWSLAVFFAYAGIASGAGVWAFTYLTEHRGLGSTAGAVAVAVYWGAFTSSRFVLGWVGDRFDPNVILRWSASATVIGMAALWWSPTPLIAVSVLVATGFAHGPVFPLEVLLTPGRFGTGHTATIMGYEFAAANLGVAAVPAVIALFVGRSGLEVVPPALLVLAVVLFGSIEMLRRVSSHQT